MKGLWKWSVSPCGNSLRVTWRRDSFTGDPGRYELKALEAGMSIHRRPFGEHRRGLLSKGL